jgi:hypothetical protein
VSSASAGATLSTPADTIPFHNSKATLMSKSQPAQPRPSFLQNLVTILLIFFLVKFAMDGFNRPPETTPPQQVLQTLRENNKNVHPVRAANTYQKYLRALDAQKLPKAELEKRKLEGAVLVADTQLKLGIRNKSTAALNNAYGA